MPKNLETIVFNPSRFQKELESLRLLLESKADLSERKDILPFFKKCKHLSAYVGTFLPNINIGPAISLAFEYPFFGDFSADLLVGNKESGEFCVVEFEDACRDSIFKAGKRANPEWSARFDHGFSQLVDWFYNLDDFKATKGFAKAFGYGHIRFIGMLIIGRNHRLDDAQRNRLKWRTEKVLIDSHPINCVTFDDLHALLHNRFQLYGAAWKLE